MTKKKKKIDATKVFVSIVIANGEGRRAVTNLITHVFYRHDKSRVSVLTRSHGIVRERCLVIILFEYRLFLVLLFLENRRFPKFDATVHGLLFKFMEDFRFGHR